MEDCRGIGSGSGFVGLVAVTGAMGLVVLAVCSQAFDREESAD